jgi:hypothetical protein
MENRLILSTEKGLFPEIEVEIDGVVYPAKKVNKVAFDKFRQIEDAVGAQIYDILYEEAGMLVDAPKSVIESLALSDVRRVIEFVISQSMKAKGPEKNVFESGRSDTPKSPELSPDSSESKT